MSLPNLAFALFFERTPCNNLVQDITDDYVERFKSLRYLGDAYRLERKIIQSGNSFSLERRLIEAENCYQEALILADNPEIVGAEIERGMILLGLGRVYLRKSGGELQAHIYLNGSKAIHYSTGIDVRLAEVYAEQGNLMVRLKRYRDAEARLELARDRFYEWKNIFRYAITMSTLCKLYYEDSNGSFDRLHAAADSVRKEDNGLINYPLAEIEFIVGQAHVEEGQLSESFDSFITATQYALNFNNEAFVEVGEWIIDYCSQVARQIGPDIALTLCQAQVHFWQNRPGKLTNQQDMVVQGWINKLISTQEELKL